MAPLFRLTRRGEPYSSADRHDSPRIPWAVGRLGGRDPMRRQGVALRTWARDQQSSPLGVERVRCGYSLPPTEP